MAGFKYIKTHQSGYKEGEDWDDGPGGRVKHIVIFYGDSVHSIQALYQREGAVVMSRTHGGIRGNFEMVNLKDEPLISVSGCYGTCHSSPVNRWDEHRQGIKVIRSLKFGTDKAIYGPFGTEEGEPFSFRTGTEISGFHGHSSSTNLHAVGVHVLCPATRFLDERPVAALPPKSSLPTFKIPSGPLPFSF